MSKMNYWLIALCAFALTLIPDGYEYAIKGLGFCAVVGLIQEILVKLFTDVRKGVCWIVHKSKINKLSVAGQKELKDGEGGD